MLLPPLKQPLVPRWVGQARCCHTARWQADARMLRVSLCLRLLYLSNGLSILATAAYVAWQGGLVAFLQESSEPAAVKCLETLTIVLPCIAGILIIYTSVSSQENAFEHRQRLSWPLARCLLLLLSAWSALCLRSFDRHVNGRSWFSLGRPGELHGLAFAVILTLINAALQLRHPTGIPRVPAAAAISRQIAQRQLQGVLTIAQVDAALPPFRSLLDLLPSNEAPAIISADGSRPVLSHRELHLFIQSRVPAELAAFGVTSRDRVATVFPNGTEACVALLSVLAYATLVPLSIGATEAEIESALRECRASCVVLLDASSTASERAIRAANQIGLLVLEAEPLPPQVGLFTLRRAICGARTVTACGMPTGVAAPCEPLQRGDVALLLQTSGTTGAKKVVPHVLEDLLCGAVCLAVSGKLGKGSVCCNVHPPS